MAAGSIHPDTGETYQLDPTRPPLALVGLLSDALLDLIRRPERGERSGEGGEITPEQLAVLLAALDPRKYGRGKYDDWIRIAAACHDATNGEGLEEWLAWCARDPDYGSEVTERNIAHWESFTAGHPAGATFKTLLAAVSAAGRRDLVARLGVSDDDLCEAEPGIAFEVDEAEPGIAYELVEDDEEERHDG